MKRKDKGQLILLEGEEIHLPSTFPTIQRGRSQKGRQRVSRASRKQNRGNKDERLVFHQYDFVSTVDHKG